MKSYSEVDNNLEMSVHQDMGKKKRVSRVVFGAGVFLVVSICGFALLTAIGKPYPNDRPRSLFLYEDEYSHLD
jgi:hypothetical protein